MSSTCSPSDVDRVRLGGAADRRLDHAGREPEVGERLPDDVVRQAQQSPGLVVDQLHPARGVHQDEPLADRRQHGAVVLVHPGDLPLAQPVGLAAQATADQPRPGEADRQGAEAGQRDARQVAPQLLVDAGQRGAHRHERDDAAVVADRDHRADRAPQRAGVLLGEDPAARRVAQVADEPLADEGGGGVRVALPVQGHDDDEVDARVGPHRLGVRLQRRAGVVGAQGLPHGGGVGHRQPHATPPRRGRRPGCRAGRPGWRGRWR